MVAGSTTQISTHILDAQEQNSFKITDLAYPRKCAYSLSAYQCLSALNYSTI